MTGISFDPSRRKVFVVARYGVDLSGLEVQEPRIVVRGAVDGYLALWEGHTTPDTLDPPVSKSRFEDGRVSVKWGLRGSSAIKHHTAHVRSCLRRKTGGKTQRKRVREENNKDRRTRGIGRAR